MATYLSSLSFQDGNLADPGSDKAHPLFRRMLPVPVRLHGAPIRRDKTHIHCTRRLL